MGGNSSLPPSNENPVQVSIDQQNILLCKLLQLGIIYMYICISWFIVSRILYAPGVNTNLFVPFQNCHTMTTLNTTDLTSNFTSARPIWPIRTQLNTLTKSKLAFLRISECYLMHPVYRCKVGNHVL